MRSQVPSGSSSPGRTLGGMQRRSRLGWTRKSREPNTRDSEDLSDKRRSGEAKALAEQDFEFLYSRYYRYLYSFFLVRGCSPEECQDLIQETFLKAYRGSRKFRGEASVRTWLLKIAGHTFQNFIRSRSALKRNAKVVSLQDLQKSPSPPSEVGFGGRDPFGPLERMLGAERKNLLEDALQDLPPRMRTCLQLRIHEDLKYREIATLMQISIQTVKSQLSQAKKRLKESLSKHFEDDDFEELD